MLPENITRTAVSGLKPSRVITDVHQRSLGGFLTILNGTILYWDQWKSLGFTPVRNPWAAYGIYSLFGDVPILTSQKGLSVTLLMFGRMSGEMHPVRALVTRRNFGAVDVITKVLHESWFRGDPNTKKALKDIQSVGFWDYSKLQTAEVNVMRNYRELLENKRQKMAEDIIYVNTKLENAESLLKTARDPDQRTAVPLRESFLLCLFNFVAVNFKLFTKSRQNVHHHLMEALCGFLYWFTFYVYIILILASICILVGGLAATFAAVSCSLYVKTFKQV